jgi:hypothetical protein
MNRLTLALLTVMIGTTVTAAEPIKDTSAAAFTRTKKLKGKLTLDTKNEPIGDTLKEISSQLEDQKLGALSVTFDVGVSKNTKTTFACKELPAEEALDGLLKTLDLGYVVISKDKDRYDGWLKLMKGTSRGYESGAEPKAEPTTEPKPVVKPEPKPAVKPEPRPVPVEEQATEQEEKAATVRLATAKELLEKGKDAEAKPLLKYLVKYCANTKAAAEAKELLGKMN